MKDEKKIKKEDKPLSINDRIFSLEKKLKNMHKPNITVGESSEIISKVSLCDIIFYIEEKVNRVTKLYDIDYDKEKEKFIVNIGKEVYNPKRKMAFTKHMNKKHEMTYRRLLETMRSELPYYKRGEFKKNVTFGYSQNIPKDKKVALELIGDSLKCSMGESNKATTYEIVLDKCNEIVGDIMRTHKKGVSDTKQKLLYELENYLEMFSK